MLTLHEELEETFFYPPLKKEAAAKDMVLEAYEEHHVMDLLIEEISNLKPSDEAWPPKIKVLQENTRHHVEEEEGELFPKVRKIWDADRREQIGRQMQDAKSHARKRSGPPDAPAGRGGAQRFARERPFFPPLRRHIGLSYPKGEGAWDGIFYPPKLADKDKLTFYAQYFNTVEINSSFYRPPACTRRAPGPPRCQTISASRPSCGRSSPTPRCSRPRLAGRASRGGGFRRLRRSIGPLAEAGKLGPC